MTFHSHSFSLSLSLSLSLTLSLSFSQINRQRKAAYFSVEFVKDRTVQYIKDRKTLFFGNGLSAKKDAEEYMKSVDRGAWVGECHSEMEVNNLYLFTLSLSSLSLLSLSACVYRKMCLTSSLFTLSLTVCVQVGAFCHVFGKRVEVIRDQGVATIPLSFGVPDRVLSFSLYLFLSLSLLPSLSVSLSLCLSGTHTHSLSLLLCMTCLSPSSLSLTH